MYWCLFVCKSTIGNTSNFACIYMQNFYVIWKWIWLFVLQIYLSFLKSPSINTQNSLSGENLITETVFIYSVNPSQPLSSWVVAINCSWFVIFLMPGGEIPSKYNFITNPVKSGWADKHITENEGRAYRAYIFSISLVPVVIAKNTKNVITWGKLGGKLLQYH